jgi:hypothetical protein
MKCPSRRARLAALRVLGAGDGAEETGRVGHLHDEIDVAARRTRADRLAKGRGVQPFQQLARPGQQRYTLLPGGGLVQILLAVAEFGDRGVVEAVAGEVADDFGVAPAEGGGEVGAGEVAAEAVAQFDPGTEVQLGGIDEGAVNVPDDGTGGRFGHQNPHGGERRFQ